MKDTLKKAQVNAAFSTARVRNEEANKLEQDPPAIGSTEEARAAALEVSWIKAVDAYQNAIIKAQGAGLSSKVREWSDTFLSNAEIKKAFWTNERAAHQEIIRWNNHVAEAATRGRLATRRANERHKDEEAANQAVTALNETASRATAAFDYWSGILTATRAGTSPFQATLNLEAISNELQKWEGKKLYQKLKPLLLPITMQENTAGIHGVLAGMSL